MLTCPILVHLIMRRYTLGCSSIYVKFNDAIRQGHTNVMIWTVDSDVVVSLLAIKFFIANHNGLLQCIFKTLMPGQGNLLIGFGTSRHYRLIPICQYVEALGPKVDG